MNILSEISFFCCKTVFVVVNIQQSSLMFYLFPFILFSSFSHYTLYILENMVALFSFTGSSASVSGQLKVIILLLMEQATK
jgi:hypothetical protein